jgi:hypothetical protein
MLYSKRLSAYGFVFFAFTSCLVLVILIRAYAGKNKQHHASGVSYASANAFYPTACGTTTNIDRCATSVQLNAEAGQSNYLWSTGQTSSSITVNTSGTYWWETVDQSTNQVSNGTFSSGNVNINSSYTYIPLWASTGSKGPLDKEGTYTITTNPRNAHSDFPVFGDHTGNGNMMVVNGAPTVPVTIWKQSITVRSNTDYIFSVWFTSAFYANPGRLNFSINGDALGAPIELSSTTGIWQNFTVRWNSGDSNSAIIGIVNQNTAATGNDFALDDIEFYPVCRNYFNVTLKSNPPKPTITPL